MSPLPRDHQNIEQQRRAGNHTTAAPLLTSATEDVLPRTEPPVRNVSRSPVETGRMETLPQPEEGAGTPNPVVAHLDAAVQAARDTDMSAAEVMGLLFFYAHNVGQDARENVTTS